MKHERWCKGASFSADGQRILTWSIDGTVRLWSAGNSQCITVFKHGRSVTSACFDRSETRILSTSEDGTARLWDISLDDGLPIKDRILEFEVRSATALGPDGQVRVLSVAEWEHKRTELLETEIRLRRAIVPPGGTRPLTPEEHAAKQRQLGELRQQLSK
jgi:WD40 repeat protein